MTAALAKLTDISIVDWKQRDAFYVARGAWQQWVRCDSKLSSTAKVAAWEISDRMSPDNDGAWPSQELIAARIGCGERTARSAVNELMDRAWLMARRGGFEGKDGRKARDGFKEPYTYIMTASESVLREVIDGEQLRVARFKDNRLRLPSREEIGDILRRAIPAENGRSYRQEIAAHTGRNLPLIPAENGRIICTGNLSREPVHGISEDKRLGETEQEEAQGHQLLPSKSPSSVLPDTDEADEQLRVEEDVIAAIGKVAGGDLARGRQLARRLGKPRLQHLFELAHDRGVGGAFSDIVAAAQAALQIESTSQIEVTT